MSETGRNFIAGAWCDGQSTIANINPSDLSDQIGHYAQANSAQLDSALDAAQTAQKKWAITGLEARQTILMNIGNELMERRIELGTLLSREEGKPLAEGLVKSIGLASSLLIMLPKYFGRSVIRPIVFVTASKLTFGANRLGLLPLSALGISRPQRLSGKLRQRWLLAMRSSGNRQIWCRLRLLS
jgi:hypothetical protein